MYKVILILDKFLLKYEGGSQIDPPPEKLPSKSPALLGLREFKQIYSLVFNLKSSENLGFQEGDKVRISLPSENCRFSDDFRGNTSASIYSNSFNIRSEIWKSLN